jgi:hypothetical protein
MFFHTDLNSLPAMEDTPPHLNNERNSKVGADRMQGRQSVQPIPPDYYYEDSQEGKFHAPHAHGSEVPHHSHPVQGEQENIAYGATPMKVSRKDNIYLKIKEIHEPAKLQGEEVQAYAFTNK